MRRFAVTVQVLVLLLVLAAPRTLAAPKLPRVGMLCAPFCDLDNPNDPLVDELRKLGWIEGKTITIAHPDYHYDQLPVVATELVQSKPDLIATIGPQNTRAAKNATSDIPIVMLFVADPVGLGLASSLAHPGGNLTGVSTFVPGAFTSKAMEVLREMVPQAKRLAVFINPSNETHRLLYPKEVPPAAAKLGFQLDLFELRSIEEVPEAIAAAKARGADTLNLWADAILSTPPNRVPELAAQAGLPSFSLWRSFAEAGGLIAYSPDVAEIDRRGAHYVDRILKGAKPAELPIEQPSKYELVINLKTARSLGIEVPASLLAQADRVIE